MRDGTLKYQAAAAANVVVCTAPAILIGIIVGKYVSGGIIEVSNSVDDGAGDIQIYLESVASDTNGARYVPVNSVFSKGICADLTGSQTNVTFIYSPL